MLTVVPAISFLHLCSLEMVFVDYHTNSATALIFKTANHAAMTIDLHVTTRTHNFSGKHDGEIDHRADRNIAIHGEQDSVRRDVLRLCGTCPALGHDLHRQMQG